MQSDHSHDAHAVRIPIPSRSTPAPDRLSPSVVVPQKRPLDVQSSLAPSAVSDLASTSAQCETTIKQAGATRQPSGKAQPQKPSASTQETDAHDQQLTALLAKRRGTKEYQATASANDRSVSRQNAPLPSTETNDTTYHISSPQIITTPTHKLKTKKPRDSAGLAARSGAEKVSRGPRPRPEHNAQGESVDAQAVAGSQDTQSQSRREQVKRRRSRKQVLQDAAAEIVGDAVQGAARAPKKRGRKSKRAETPEDAESIRIAPSETKMMELCRDGGIGRKSMREQELREMDRAAFVKKKQGELQEMMGQAESPNQVGSAEPADRREGREERQREREENVALNVPNTIIVNGQIQIDEESLQIDRHAAAAVLRDIEELEPIDENDLSRKVTSGSWLKRDKSGGWNEILLDRFYQGLRMFGTDFEMISMMFPGKTRHAIKLKFCREEKLDCSRIQAALMGEKLPVVLEEYEKLTGTEYEDPKELERLMDEDRRKLEEEQTAEKQALDDAIREREAQAAAEREAAGGDSGKENQQRRRKKKSGKTGQGVRRKSRPRKEQLGLAG